MDKRRGRPKEFMTKDDRVTIRLTKEELYWLNCLIDKTGKSKSKLFTEAIKIMYDLYKWFELLSDKKSKNELLSDKKSKAYFG